MTFYPNPDRYKSCISCGDPMMRTSKRLKCHCCIRAERQSKKVIGLDPDNALENEKHTMRRIRFEDE